jgi:hypothetical protein
MNMVFDILYLGGPDASKVMEDPFTPSQKRDPKPLNVGSIPNTIESDLKSLSSSVPLHDLFSIC